MSKAERIEEYSKDYNYAIKGAGAYEGRFLKSLDNAVAAVGQRYIECPAIIYLQGERDYVTDSQAPDAQPGSVDSAYACGGDKELYKQRMLDLKNDMQSDIMSRTGQSYKPIFCIYQVSGVFIKNDQMTINMAQIEFAELVEQSTNQGFSVYIDDVYVDVITSVDIDENRIKLTCNNHSSDCTSSLIEIEGT